MNKDLFPITSIFKNTNKRKDAFTIHYLVCFNLQLLEF